MLLATKYSLAEAPLRYVPLLLPRGGEPEAKRGELSLRDRTKETQGQQMKLAKGRMRA
jgi:hypothetical protein